MAQPIESHFSKNQFHKINSHQKNNNNLAQPVAVWTIQKDKKMTTYLQAWSTGLVSRGKVYQFQGFLGVIGVEAHYIYIVDF